MGFNNSYLMCFALMLTLSSSINALDITKFLGAYPEFSTFNKYLTETKLAERINAGKAATVLALDNAALASLAGKPVDAIKTVVGTHVINDYYDEKRMVDAIGSHTELATFSQPIFANLIGEGEVAFASAKPGSAYDTKLVRAVTNQPGVVSVLEVTQAIVAPVATAAAASKSSPVGSASPVGSIVAQEPKSVVTEEPTVDAEGPTSVVSEAPVAAAPASAPSSSSSRTQMGVFGAVVAFASIFVSL